MSAHTVNSGRLARFFKRLFAPKDSRDKDIYESNEYENLDTSRKDMIRGVMELSEKNAKDIMIPRVDVFSIESEINLANLVKKVCDAGHSRLPVYKETIDNIIGILYAKDLIRTLSARSRKFVLKKILHEPFYVPETMPLDELLLEFKKRKLHLAIVVDEYGGVGGIVTLEDILEEIVGDIDDEFDHEELPEFEKIGPAAYEVDSRLTLNDFNRMLGTGLLTDEFDTIGGFVFDLFGKVPKKNETVSFENLSFKIKDVKGTVINRIIVTVSP